MKQRRRREEIEHWLDVRDREGLTLRETAERAGIPVGTLSWWTHRLRHQRQNRRASFVELIPRSDSADELVDGLGDEVAPCVLRLPSGAVVEARGPLAELLIERVTAGLSPCS